MKAFLDDVQLIRVIAEKSFYNGELDGFYVRRANEIIDCHVEHRYETDDVIYYDLVSDQRLSVEDDLWLGQDKGKAIPIEVRWIVRSPIFQEKYTSRETLGSFCMDGKTIFHVWSPTAKDISLIFLAGQKRLMVQMERKDQGIFEAILNGNHHGLLYRYRIHQASGIYEITDPYALSATANGEWGCVVDTNQTQPTIHPIPVIENLTDAVIYETNIRDFTSLLDVDNHHFYKDFGALCIDGKTSGWDYLKRLGVTHLQLMPVLDFATVEENDPMRLYNWGYDPVSMFTIEGSYASDPNDPIMRIREFQDLVSHAHQNGMGVILDVVYNHLYDGEDNVLEKCCPYYTYRYENGHLSNGTGCGNDLDSQAPMVRRLIVDSLVNLVKLYDVDGFRFDLMGILDIETMHTIEKELAKIKKNIFLYGEGWNMNTPLAQHEKACMDNQSEMPNIGMFNDVFRDVLKGATHDDAIADKGYLSGDLSKKELFAQVMRGSCTKDLYIFEHPTQSINQVETHDNGTLWDKLSVACADESEEIRVARQKMMIACILFAQGVPFLHAGMEFCGTKQGDSNSYRSGDHINGMDWQRMVKYQDVVEYTARCIAFRKANSQLRLSSTEEIESKTSIQYYDDDCLCIDMDDLRLIVNPNTEARTRQEKDYGLIFDERGESAHRDVQPGLSVWVYRKENCDA